MRKALVSLIVGAAILGASVPSMAGGVFDDSSDWGHFVAGMIVQEMREDARNKQRVEEERARQEEARRREEQQARQREERERRERGDWYEVSSGPSHHDYAREDGKSKMQMLLDVHERIMDEVLEESRDSREFIIEIHNDNGRDLDMTAQDIRPFVYEYFYVFGNEQGRMYDLWVETKFEKWIKSQD